MQRYLMWLCSLATITMLSASFSFAQSVDDLVVFTEEYPPYNYTADGKVVGSSTEIVLDVLERLGSKLTRNDIQVVPWARAYNEVTHNKNAIIFSIARSGERESQFKWVCSLGCLTIGVIAHKQKGMVINGLADLRKYRIGVVREDIGHQMIRKLIPEKKLDIANSSTANLRKLQERRIDMFVYDVDKFIKHVLARLRLNAREYEVVHVLGKMSICLAFNKDADDGLVDKFRTALREVVQERKTDSCPPVREN